MTIWNLEITASESPQTVHIPLEGKYYAIKNTGDHDILVSSYVASPTEGADDVMKIPSGSAAVIPVKDGDLYVSAEEDGTYSVSIQDDKVVPWSGGTGSGGGSGGDNTHYKGTTTTALTNGSTTNPIVIDGESYTAVFGDVVVYGYTEFVFDGTAWSEFGRPFDTVPTQGSTNAVTSDGIYKRTPLARSGASNTSAFGGEFSTAQGRSCFAYGYYVSAGAGNISYASAFGYNIQARYDYLFACGTTNNPLNGDLFEIGNGVGSSRSNILEVNHTSANVNGDIKRDGVGIDDYTTTERKIGKWIDGSDLYQRTFEVTGLVNGQWNDTALGTSDIDIKAFDGYIRYLYNGEFNANIQLNYYSSSGDYVATQNQRSDLSIKPNRVESGMAIDKAIITIKYTKSLA